MMTVEQLVVETVPFLLLMVLAVEILAVLALVFWLLPEMVQEPEKALREPQRFWRRLQRGARWVQNHLVELVSLSLLVVVGARLYPFLLGEDPFSGTASESWIKLGLVLAFLALAVLAQQGGRLLPRLKKVGPVEFVEERMRNIQSELDKFENLVRLDAEPFSFSFSLSETLRYEYEKANNYVTHLEWTGLRGSELAQDSSFHKLLFKVATVAMLERDWVRASDRFELLFELSKGMYGQEGEARSRCGQSHLGLTFDLQKQLQVLGKKREELKKSQPGLGKEQQKERERNENEIMLTRRREREHRSRAHENLLKAVQLEPHNSKALLYLAYVQVDLQAYEPAKKNNETALENRDDLAEAKYNLAVCHVFLGNHAEALEALRKIGLDDWGVKMAVDRGLKDPELKPLLEDPLYGPQARWLFRSLRLRLL